MSWCTPGLSDFAGIVSVPWPAVIVVVPRTVPSSSTTWACPVAFGRLTTTPIVLALP